MLLRRRGWALLVVAAAASASCQQVSRRNLPTVLVQALARTGCAGDGGPECGEPGWSHIQAPHCGYSFNSLEDPGTLNLHVGVPAAGVRGMVQVETSVESSDGGTEQLPSRRFVAIEAEGTRVYSVFTSELLYEVDHAGLISPVPRDAGDPVGDGGSFVFRYQALASDAGPLEAVEMHRVVAVQEREVEVFDSSGDPFAGCCAQVGWETPALLPLALLARLLLRRRRHA